MNEYSKKIYDPTRPKSGNFIRITTFIYLIAIMAMIFIYKVLNGNCDITGDTSKCENGGAIMYTILVLTIFSSFLVMPTWLILCAGEYIGEF